jgi:mannan endo-1,4-beta-mannosidase
MAAPPPTNADFVRVSSDGTHFRLENAPFYFCGANCYYLMTRAAEKGTMADAAAVLDDLAAAGVTVVRTWAFADGPQWNALQPEPGVYDERVFRGLDWVVAEAGRRGLRLVLPLVNYWRDYGGMGQYVAWSRKYNKKPPPEDPEDPSEFYHDERCQAVYSAFVAAVLTRVNTLTGVAYRDDPTIIGWAPANEPQCRRDPGAAQGVLAAWTARAAGAIKALAPRQLVFTDCEGFWGGPHGCSGGSGGSSGQRLGANPYDCAHKGCDFEADCAVSSVDVACCHLYPDSWLPHAPESDRLAFSLAWLDAHVAACRRAGKPLVLSEFGRKAGEELGGEGAREAHLAAVLQRALDLMRAGAPLAGTMFWTAAARSYTDYDGFTIYLGPEDREKVGEGQGGGVATAAAAIVQHAAAVQTLNRKSGSTTDGGLGRAVGPEAEERAAAGDGGGFCAGCCAQ